jgi:hypothetical protein
VPIRVDMVIDQTRVAASAEKFLLRHGRVGRFGSDSTLKHQTGSPPCASTIWPRRPPAATIEGRCRRGRRPSPRLPPPPPASQPSLSPEWPPDAQPACRSTSGWPPTEASLTLGGVDRHVVWNVHGRAVWRDRRRGRDSGFSCSHVVSIPTTSGWCGWNWTFASHPARCARSAFRRRPAGRRVARSGRLQPELALPAPGDLEPR